MVEPRSGVCQPPEWSGKFWEQDEFGFISVHVSDERTHVPPHANWRFVRTYAAEEDDAQVFLYRLVCEDCPCMHSSEGMSA